MSLFMNTALFLSTHTNPIDGKGRVSFPAPFRSALKTRESNGIVIFRSLVDAAIEGMTIERLLAMSGALESLPPFAPERALFQTAIFGTAQELQVEKDGGRCSLPRDLLEQVGISSEVSFLGCGATFQIWEPQALARRTADAAKALTSGAISFPVLPAGVM